MFCSPLQHPFEAEFNYFILLQSKLLFSFLFSVMSVLEAVPLYQCSSLRHLKVCSLKAVLQKCLESHYETSIKGQITIYFPNSVTGKIYSFKATDLKYLYYRENNCEEHEFQRQARFQVSLLQFINRVIISVFHYL